MSTQSEKISIDISKNYNVKKKAGEVIHQAAYEKLKEYVKDALLSNTASTEIQEITDCRWHNTIFVGGERGSGKTTFLVNLDDALGNMKDASNNEINLFILKPIDPTIIDNGDNFILIILGQINKEIERRDNGNKFDKDIDKKKKYYETLKDVAEAIESKQLIKSNNDTGIDTGIDTVLSYQSSLDLEEKLHKFFHAVCELVNKSIIILRIDDVDMAFDSGFEILEVLRKYTASPYIMPVVTGDMKLYNTIISQEMYNKIQQEAYEKTHIYSKKSELVDKYKHILPRQPEKIPENLTDEYKYFIIDHMEKYIAKVFPSDRQINLECCVSKILTDKYTFFYKESKKYTYKQIEQLDEAYHSLLFGNMERENTETTLPKNIRLFFQYLAKKLPVYKDVTELQRKIGSFKSIIVNDYKQVLTATAEFCQNLIESKDIFLEVKTNLDAIDENNNFSVQQVLHGVYFDPLENINLKINPELLFKTPLCVKNKNKTQGVGKTNPHEFVVSCLKNNTKPFVEKIKEQLPPNTNITDAAFQQSLFFWNLFTHSNYYTSYQQTNFLFAGKFVEMVFSSLSLDFDYKLANNILKKDPFFANISKTKHSETEEPDDIDGEDEDTDEQDDIIETNEDVLFLINHFKSLKDKQKLPKDDGKSDIFPTRFLHAVLNKFFNNVNTYKTNSCSTASSLKKKYLNETFDIYIIRMCYMLLNAVAYFESEETVVSKDNIALNKSVTKSQFVKNIRSSSAYRRNIKKMYDIENSLTRLLHENVIIKAMIGDAGVKLTDDSKMMFEIFKHIKVSTSPTSVDVSPIHTQTMPTAIEKSSADWGQAFLNAQDKDDLQKLTSEYKAQYPRFGGLKDIVSNIKTLLSGNPNETYGLIILMGSDGDDIAKITTEKDTAIIDFIKNQA